MPTSILIVSPHADQLSGFITALANQSDVTIRHAVSGEEALSLIRQTAPSLAVIDACLDGSHGVKLSRDILMIDAMVSIAILSDMPEDQFHEHTEGLGILLQLPTLSGSDQADLLWKRYRQLT